jgi:hypothetical protein
VDNAVAIGAEIDALFDIDQVREPLVGPQPRLVREEGTALDRVARADRRDNFVRPSLSRGFIFSNSQSSSPQP